MRIKTFLYAFGRATTNNAWYINPSRVINRLYYVNSGTAIVRYANKEHTLCAGTLYLLPQNEDFCSVNSAGFDHTFFDYYSSPALRFDSFIEIPGRLFGINALFHFINTNIAEHHLEHHAANLILTSVLCTLSDHIQLPYISNSIVNDALELIRKNANNITTKDLAKQLHLNECYFIQLFTRTIGIPPMKYIRSCRLAEGQLMLKKGMSVIQASERCGYSTPAAFWKAVQKEFGCSPSELKNKAVSDDEI